jgi:DNA-binding MarR family transcriptional regulator
MFEMIASKEVDEFVETDSHIKELKELVVDYLERHPNISINALAKRSSISTSTLRRLVKDKSKSEVAPHIVLNLVCYIKRKDNLAEVMTCLPKGLKLFLKTHFGQFIFTLKNYSLDKDLNH